MKKSIVISFLALLMPLLNLWAEAPAIQIAGEIDTGTIIVIDAGTKATLDTNATDQYDPFYDRPKPPHSPTNYLSIYFPHPEWQSIFGDNFMIDARNGDDDLTNSVKVFAFEALSDLVGEEVNLSFTISANYPANYGAILYDYTTQTYQNLRDEGEYNYTAGLNVREFDLRLGDGTAPAIEITFPPADTILYSETTYQLTWGYTDVNPIRYSKAYYSLDNGLNWTFIDSIAGGVNSCNWTTPEAATNTAKIKVEAEDWAGNFGTEITEYTFILDNHTLPVITISFPTNDTLLFYNTTYNVTWTTVTNVTPSIYNILYYSLDDGNSWVEIDSIPAGLDLAYSWTTPSSFSAFARIKVVAEDEAGNVGEGITDWTFNIAPNYLATTFSPPWQLLSVPLMTDSNSVQAIFGDDITGPYFVYAFSQTGGGYSLAEAIQHGKGYWLALMNTSTVDVSGLPEVDSTYLQLEEGWNIVGAAIATTIPKDSLRFSNGIYILSFADAVDSGWVLPNLYSYDNQMGNYVLVNTVEPWKGYWFYAQGDEYDMVTYPSYPGGNFDFPFVEAVDEENNLLDWFIPIYLKRGNTSERIAGLGTSNEATDGYDVWYEVLAPPASPDGNYLRAIFEHPEWALAIGSDFSRDVRSAFDLKNEYPQVKEWRLMIESSDTGRIIVDFLDIKKYLPKGYTAVALYNGISQNLLETHWFTFDYSAPLEVVVRIANPTATITSEPGTSALEPFPQKFSLLGISPNPFNPITTIKVALPLSSELNVKVYDLNGRLVSVLAEGYYPSGYLNFNFNGKNLSSGIYFVNVIIPDKLQEIRKIALIK
jgi:hypothetical protein